MVMDFGSGRDSMQLCSRAVSIETLFTTTCASNLAFVPSATQKSYNAVGRSKTNSFSLSRIADASALMVCLSSTEIR